MQVVVCAPDLMGHEGFEGDRKGASQAAEANLCTGPASRLPPRRCAC